MPVDAILVYRLRLWSELCSLTMPGADDHQQRAPRWQRSIVLCLLAITLAGSWWIGVRGVAFGTHWDEEYVIAELERTADTGRLLPGRYFYPSLPYAINVLACTPELLPLFFAQMRGEPVEATPVKTLLQGEAVSLRLRTVFLTIVSLTIVWTFLISMVWRRSRWQALLAAALLASSWEIGYHARWIAPDGLMMQFGALTIALLMIAFDRPDRRRWLVGATIAAGCTCSAKWTGGIVLVPVVTAAAMIGWRQAVATGRRGIVGAGGHAVAVVCGFAAVLIATTPAILVEPGLVVYHIAYEIEHYGSRGFGGSTVNGFFDHALLLMRYFATRVGSPCEWLAVTVAALAGLGAAVALRVRDRQTLILMLTPLLFVPYMATQKLMIVRNMLICLPIGAVLAAAGAGALHRLVARSTRLPVVPILSIVLVVANMAWNWRAADSIRQREGRDEMLELAEVVADSSERFALSKAIAAALGERQAALENASFATADWIVFFSSEVPYEQRRAWPANRVTYRLLRSGPWEVNWDYYPTWVGEPRVLMLPRTQFESSGLASIIE